MSSFLHLIHTTDPHDPLHCEACAFHRALDAITPCTCASPEEHAAIRQTADPLLWALYEALTTYSDTHEPITYSEILHALDGLLYCIKAQMQEEALQEENPDTFPHTQQGA